MHAALRWRWIAGVARRLARLAAGTAVAVKFPGELAAVVLTGWRSSSALACCARMSPGTARILGSALRRPPSHAALVRLERAKAGRITVRADNGIRLANAGDLVKTGMIEAVLASAVITVSASRRATAGKRRAAAGTDVPRPAG